MEINDEILNYYFDGDLSSQEREEILRAVENSPILRNKFDSLKQANDLLFSVKADEVSENFASIVMSKLNA